MTTESQDRLSPKEARLPNSVRYLARRAKTAAFVCYKTLNATVIDQTPLREMSRFHGIDIVTMEGFMRQRQYHWFESLFRDQNINRVVETGFNGGHSAFTFANLGAKAVTSFDIGEHTYVQPAAQFVRQRFPDTDFELIIGDSRKTVPTYSGTADFDLSFVDGGHDVDVASSDITNLHKLSSNGGLVVVDDYCPTRGWLSGPSKAYNQAVSVGMIEPIEVSSGDFRTWALGKFVK